MLICDWVLTPIVIVIRTLIRVVREVVRTVCEWVTSTITVVKEVCEEVCGWLGPLSFLCDWVCKLIEVVETFTEWVCREVIDRIISWVETFVEYVIYLLRWVCWLIEWPFRLVALIACVIGFHPRRTMRVCVKILTDSSNNPAVPLADVDGMMQDAAAILARCQIELLVVDRQLISKQEYLDTTTCNFAGMFSGFFVWFSRMACEGRCTVTVYFVRDIVSASGCAYPGANWVTIDAQGDGSTVVQEIGHLADLWAHTSDPDNVMTDQGGGTHDQITNWQCCMIRTSRFTCNVNPIELTRQLAADAIVVASETPFRRKSGAPESKDSNPDG